MRQRWQPVAILAGILFAINAVARLIIWQANIADESNQTTIGFLAFIAIGLVFVAVSAWWAIRYPLSRVAGDLLVAGLAGCLLSVFVGPFFGGASPFAEGGGLVMVQIVQYLLLALLGTFLGVLGVIALGRDWKTRVWKQREAQLKKRTERSSR
ncbi:MAG: hypothetical protein H0T78_06945 [Longispora sp.]|nr:hypothetical protein [Longispora sp. (in: high G+C Gram-positive bacteria)]